MSAFVGYDPERLALLRRAIIAADEHLGLLQLRYPGELESGAVRQNIAAVRHLLGATWKPIIERVLTSGALDDTRGGHPTGWLRQPDPLGPSVGAENARAVAVELVRHGAPPERLVDLLASVARDPSAVTAFRVAVSEEDWTAIVDQIGLAHLTAAHRAVDAVDDVELQRQMALLDDAAALLALIVRGRPDGHRPWLPDELQHADPYAAALVMRHLRLDALVLARTVDRLLLRAYEGRPDGDRFADGYLSGPNAGDLLFPLLISRPIAATAFLQRAARHPAVVFMSAQDQRLVRDLLLVGTAPETISASTAGTILPPLLQWSSEARRRVQSHDGGTRDAATYLAEASAPWLLYFGRRAPEWNWSEPAADRALRDLIDDERAMDRLIDALGAWRRSMATASLIRTDGQIDLDALLDLSTMFAQVELAFRDEEVDDDSAARFWLEVTLFTATLIASAAVSGGFLASVGTDLALTVASATGAAALGRFGVATSADRSERQAAARFGSRSADVAVIAVVSTVSQLIDAGRLPTDALDRLDLSFTDGCEPTVIADRLARFVASLEQLTDAATFNALTAVMTAFLNPSSARQACR